MKPPPLLWLRADSIESALEGLARYGDEAKLIAGGQSLVPLLNFRLARPGVLVDINRIAELSYIHADDGTLSIGALTRQRELERSPVVGRACPLLSRSMRHVGHAQIRNRGTVGGSIAHADPAAELPAVAVALDAEIVTARPDGERTIPARELFEGPLMTTLGTDEMIVAMRLRIRPGVRTAFREVARRAGDFALAGVAAGVELDGRGAVATASLAALGVGSTPVRLSAAEQALAGEELGPGAIAEAARAAAAEVSPPADVFADPDYRRELVATLVRRTLTELSETP